VRPPAPALPLPGADSLASRSGLSALIRRTLLAALALALTAAVLEAGNARFHTAAVAGTAESAGVVVLDLSGSMQHDGPLIRRYLAAIENALDAHGRIGLVVFSDSAGITLPATAPVSALERAANYFPRRWRARRTSRSSSATSARRRRGTRRSSAGRSSPRGCSRASSRSAEHISAAGARST
jgi:hypothetical protein